MSLRYAILLLMLLGLMISATGCSAGNPTSDLGLSAGSTSSGRGDGQSTGLALDESELDQLETWQQELLADEGWNQPYIEPIPGTPMPAPDGSPEVYPGSSTAEQPST